MASRSHLGALVKVSNESKRVHVPLTLLSLLQLRCMTFRQRRLTRNAETESGLASPMRETSLMLRETSLTMRGTSLMMRETSHV